MSSLPVRVAAACVAAFPLAAQDTSALPKPSPSQQRWHDLQLGMFVHFAPNTWQDREYDDLSTPLDRIDPKELDTDQWVAVAKAMGARYVVFVAKHTGGFCWWQTGTTEYSVGHTAWRDGKGDVMRDLATSCRQVGLLLGVYLSPADRRHQAGVGGKCANAELQQAYEALFRAQLEELLTRYGSISEVWFDGSLVFDVGDLLAAHAPDAVVFQGPQASIRWVGNEDGIAPYPAWNGARFDRKNWGRLTADDGDPTGDRWLPNECDARMRNSWFWRSDNAATLKRVDQLLAMYERSVGRGAVLLLNHTPDPSGRIPEADAVRAAEFGAEVQRRYGSAVADTMGRGSEHELQLSAPRPVDAVMTMEDIAGGERVRAYVVEGLVDGSWHELCRGSAIGHRRLDTFPAREVAALRLRVLDSVGEPQLRRFAAFATGTARK